LVLRFFGDDGNDRLLLLNLGSDITLSPVSEPLLAPPENASWKMKWCSEASCYGGCGVGPLETEGDWELPAQAAVVLEPYEDGQADSTD